MRYVIMVKIVANRKPPYGYLPPRGFLQDVVHDSVNLTLLADDALKFDTELDAKCTAQYLPANTEYTIEPLGE